MPFPLRGLKPCSFHGTNFMIFKNDYGIVILIDMQTDLSGATNYSLQVTKPNGTIVTWNPIIYNDRLFRYVIKSGDLDQSGTYTIQPVMALNEWVGSCNKCQFEVSF